MLGGRVALGEGAHGKRRELLDRHRLAPVAGQDRSGVEGSADGGGGESIDATAVGEQAVVDLLARVDHGRTLRNGEAG